MLAQLAQLAQLARQVGLGLHNVEVDSALQKPLEELRRPVSLPPPFRTG